MSQALRNHQKITVLIDHLGPGGAQRQACRLAGLLARNGHEVTVLTYYPNDFFAEMLSGQPRLHWINIQCHGQIQRLVGLSKEFKKLSPSCVIAFLEVPSMLAVIIRLVQFRSFRLIVSERNTDLGRPSLKGWLKWLLFAGADLVVPNSHAQARYIAKHAAWLKKCVRVITNCVELGQRVNMEPVIDGEVRLLVLGRYAVQKNGVSLIRALAMCRDRRAAGPAIRLDWYGGDPHAGSEVKKLMLREIEKCGLEEQVFLHEAASDVAELMAKHHALCLCSHYEGCANVVCEAMAAGLPSIVTDVGDNAYLIRDGKDGVVIGHTDPESICAGLMRFVEMGEENWRQMGWHARSQAEELLSADRFSDEWEKLICCG